MAIETVANGKGSPIKLPKKPLAMVTIQCPATYRCLDLRHPFSFYPYHTLNSSFGLMENAELNTTALNYGGNSGFIDALLSLDLYATADWLRGR
jgi:hypothetical protein